MTLFGKSVSVNLKYYDFSGNRFSVIRNFSEIGTLPFWLWVEAQKNYSYVFLINIFEKYFSPFVAANKSESGKAQHHHRKNSGNASEPGKEDEKSGPESSGPDDLLRSVPELHNPELGSGVPLTDPPGNVGVGVGRFGDDRLEVMEVAFRRTVVE